jgi:hypothetical protein
MADYVYQAYPKAVYTKTDDGITHCVVNSPQELKALGSGWAESPADLSSPKRQTTKTKPKTKR